MDLQNVKNYFASGSSILIVQQHNTQDQLNFVIWESPTNKTINIVLPILFHPRKVHQYIYAHEQNYILVSNRRGAKCLFTSYDKSEYFVRITCQFDSIFSSEQCPIVVHPYLPGIIYANLRDENNQLFTFVSVNDGRSFIPMRFENEKLQCPEKRCYIKLKIECKIQSNIQFPMEWMAIFQHQYNSKQPHLRQLVTFDGGITWKQTPFQNLQAIILNSGGLIVGVDSATREIAYSFDEGKKWFHKDIINQDEKFVFLVPNGNYQKEFVSIIGLHKDSLYWVVSRVNFSNILSILTKNRPDMPRARLYALEGTKT
ncbi:hypothetical protein RF11_11868 [Thelohanellus kitauei]|uniref:Sortilin N-terminal domain-containing protein n=1 Tax=Thelohanellus kitauei TaxID=669202 RepID=A0A0C2JYQ0_THEKT|nr:hypothetical protein RF11_11868 [Thelohanellus kitauei]